MTEDIYKTTSSAPQDVLTNQKLAWHKPAFWVIFDAREKTGKDFFPEERYWGPYTSVGPS